MNCHRGCTKRGLYNKITWALKTIKVESVNKILEQKAVRITPMRQLLLEYFLQNNGTFGLIELENAFPKSDRITIYRTLVTGSKDTSAYNPQNI